MGGGGQEAGPTREDSRAVEGLVPGTERGKCALGAAACINQMRPPVARRLMERWSTERRSQSAAGSRARAGRGRGRLPGGLDRAGVTFSSGV